MNRRVPVSIALAITIIAMTVTFSLTWIVSMRTFDNTVRDVTSLQAQYQKLYELDMYVRNNFYGEINNDALFDRVAVGYVAGLGDRYSAYYTAAEYAEMMQIEGGSLLGVGIEVVRDADGQFRIVRVYEDSPAARAGVTVGGFISQVDGVDAKTIATVRSLESRLYGPDGTELELNAIYNVTEQQQFNIRRSNFTPPLVEMQMLGDYAYIRLPSFARDPYADINYAVSRAIERGARGLVFDVRGNADGVFRNSYQSIDFLCPVGTVAKSVAKNGTVRVLATSDENRVLLPMAVIVDGGTAGAAELFATAVRDLAGGRVVGTVTAGHGTIQSAPYRLQDGSAVSVTVSNLLTGRDESFDNTGVTPDVAVESGEGDLVSSLASREEYLYNPVPGADTQIRRGAETVRNIVIEEGGNPGVLDFAVVVQPPAPGAEVPATPAPSSVSAPIPSFEAESAPSAASGEEGTSSSSAAAS